MKAPNTPARRRATLTISNLTADDSIPVYLLMAANSVGSVTTKEANVYFQSLPVPPAPGSYGASALSNNPVALWMLNETNDPASGLLVAYDYTGHGNSGTYQAAAQNAFNGILGPQPPAFPGFAANEGALLPTAGNNNSDVVSSANESEHQSRGHLHQRRDHRDVDQAHCRDRHLLRIVDVSQ